MSGAQRERPQALDQDSAPQGPLARWVALCARRPGAVIVSVLALGLASLAAALTLGLNTNQLEMISADSRQVRDIHRVTDMIGGAGQLTLALRGEDPAQLKAAAVYLSAHLMSAEAERVRARSE